MRAMNKWICMTENMTKTGSMLFEGFSAGSRARKSARGPKMTNASADRLPSTYGAAGVDSVVRGENKLPMPMIPLIVQRTMKYVRDGEV